MPPAIRVDASMQTDEGDVAAGDPVAHVQCQQCASLASALDAAASETAAARHDRDALEAALRTAERQATRHCARADEASRESNERAESAKQLATELDASRRLADQLRAEKAQLEAQAANDKSAISQYEQLFHAQREQASQAHRQMEQLAASQQSASAQLAQALAEQERLRAELHGERNKAKQLTGQLNSAYSDTYFLFQQLQQALQQPRAPVATGLAGPMVAPPSPTDATAGGLSIMQPIGSWNPIDYLTQYVAPFASLDELMTM